MPIVLYIDAELLAALRSWSKRLGVGVQSLIDTILATAVARGMRTAPRARRRSPEH
jgi:hypothetical protein